MHQGQAIGLAPAQFPGHVLGHDRNALAVLDFVDADQVQRTAQGRDCAV
jgi:hypothetical protein